MEHEYCGQVFSFFARKLSFGEIYFSAEKTKSLREK